MAEDKPQDHPLTVFVAENQKVADAVIELLASKNISAEVHLPPIDTTTEPLTGASEVVQRTNEFEVRVTSAAQVADAKDLITSAVGAAVVHAVREKRRARTGSVTATCEDCGKPSEWPASSMGTTEVCPHCHCYMDVPDPDEDWSGMDFGKSEEDEEEKDETKE
jgi:hypothetical protein